jgi:hypothetical protein
MANILSGRNICVRFANLVLERLVWLGSMMVWVCDTQAGIDVVELVKSYWMRDGHCVRAG